MWFQRCLCSAEEENIKCFVRFRPCGDDEGSKDAFKIINENSVEAASKPPRIFSYDYVAPPTTTQEAVFTKVGKVVVDKCMQGYNGTIFAYGQTGMLRLQAMGGCS